MPDPIQADPVELDAHPSHTIHADPVELDGPPPAIDGVLKAIDDHQSAPDLTAFHPLAGLEDGADPRDTSDDDTSYLTHDVPKGADPALKGIDLSGVIDKPTSTGAPITKAKVSVATQGLPGGAKRAGDLMSQADAKSAGAIDDINKEASGEIATSHDHLAQMAQAQAEIGKLTTEHFQNVSTFEQRQAEFFQHQQEVEQQAYQRSQVYANGVLSEYKNQQAAWKQLAMQSGNPLLGLGTGQKVALGLAAFAQGMLAVQGHNIDVTGQIDKWVERSMQEHQQMVTNARTGMQDTLNLWDIARKGAADDADARQRFRGFAVQALQAQMGAEASRYQSGMANADAAMKISQTQMDSDATDRSIRDKAFAKAHETQTMHIDAAFKQGTLELEKQKVNLEAQRLALEIAKEKAKGGAGSPVWFSDASRTQVDPKTKEATTGGLKSWFLRPVDKVNVSEAVQAKGADEAHQATAARDDIRGELQVLRKYRQDVDSWGGFQAWKERSPNYRLYEQERDLIAGTIKKGIEGLHGSDADQERFTKMLQDDAWLQKGSNAGMVDNLDRWSADRYKHNMDANPALGKRADRGAPQLAPGEEYDPKDNADPATTALGKTLTNKEMVNPQTYAEEARMTAPSRREAAKGAEHGGSQVYLNYVGDQNKDQQTTQSQLYYHGQPNQFRAIDHLAVAALRPDFVTKSGATVNGRPAEDPNDVQASAIDVLKRAASGSDLHTGGPASPEVQAYAKHILEEIHKVESVDGWGGHATRDQLLSDLLSTVDLDPPAGAESVGHPKHLR